jgi:hypothetical protein
MILFCDPTGPKLTYSEGVLRVSDPNPEVELGWRMSRWDMFKLGWRCIKAATLGLRGAKAQGRLLEGGRPRID